MLFRSPQSVPTRPVDQKPIENRLDPRHFGRHVLAERIAVAKCPGLNAPNDTPRVGHEPVELVARTDVELPKPLEKLIQIRDGRVAKDLGLSVFGPGRPFGQGQPLSRRSRERL